MHTLFCLSSGVDKSDGMVNDTSIPIFTISYMLFIFFIFFSNLDCIELEGLTLQKFGFNVACLFCFVYTWNGMVL